ncbi:MAG: dcuR [Firmicutes bacterium]|nr:dcuR [Bacillota bacterium]
MIKVLIVEDDPMVAELNRRYLARMTGFKVIAAAGSGDAALQLLDKHDIDLVLLDIYMPGMDGLDLLKQIRTLGKSVDVLAVTAASDSPSIKKALQYGAVDYLIKPFEFERLEAALSAYKTRAECMREQPTLNQSELDHCILGKEQSSKVELMKGLDRNTLKVVWENILAEQGNGFTTEEMARRVGISRVSMRKYLDFLRNLEVLHLEITYGSIGRPVYRYQCVDTDASIIKHYL